MLLEEHGSVAVGTFRRLPVGEHLRDQLVPRQVGVERVLLRAREIDATLLEDLPNPLALYQLIAGRASGPSSNEVCTWRVATRSVISIAIA